MTIQIDDAGWGCLIGGVLIGAYRVENGEFLYGEIPVEKFQGEAFTRKEYRQSAVDIAGDLLARLQVGKSEPIQVCTGYVLGEIRNWLQHNQYSWQPAKITGQLQDRIETALLERLHELGLTDVNYETLTQKQGLLFYHCVKWLKGGNPNATRVLPERERLAKTGWASYPVWAGNPYHQAKYKRKAMPVPHGHSYV